MPVPILRSGMAALARLSRFFPEEFAKVFSRGRYNTVHIKKPLPIKLPDHPSGRIHRGASRTHNEPPGLGPWAEYNPGRRINSRAAWYLAAPIIPTAYTMYWSDATHFNLIGEEPDYVQPITIEKHNNIIRIQQGKTRRSGPSEGNRRRRDTKARRYRQLLAFINRTYGTYTEVAEVAEAFQLSDTPSEFMQSLAINEGIDRIYGGRAGLLKEHVYNRDWYQLPVGIDAIRSQWGRMAQ